MSSDLDELRRRVHGTSLAAAGKFDADLHPRGKDGKFIEKGGIVKILSGIYEGQRGRVVDIQANRQNPGEPYIIVDRLDGSGEGVYSGAKLEAAPEKARLDAKTSAPAAKVKTPRATAAPGGPPHAATRAAYAETPEGQAPSEYNQRSNAIWSALQDFDTSEEYIAIQSAADQKRKAVLADADDPDHTRATLAAKWTHQSDKVRSETLKNQELLDYVKSSQTTNDVTLFRGFAAAGAKSDKLLASLVPGAEFDAGKLASFSEDQDWALSFGKTLFRVKPGKGRGVPLMDVSRSIGEQEWVGTGKYRVVGFDEGTQMFKSRGKDKPVSYTIIDIEYVDEPVAPTV